MKMTNIVAIALVLTAVAGLVVYRVVKRYQATPAERVADALGELVVSVEATDRIPAPIAQPIGQYALRLGDGREVGLFVMTYEWPLESAPFFWINLLGDPPPQAVLVPDGGKLRRDDIPPDWIMSDYLRERKPGREPSFIAMNPRRNLRVLDEGRRIVADSGFQPEHPMTTNLLARASWVVDGNRVRALSAIVHRTKDAEEAGKLMDAVDSMLGN